MQVMELDPAQVFVGDRLRAVDVEEAAKLAVSMRELGQLSPVHVGPQMEDGRYPLIAGAHRLAAVFKAGLPVVLAVEFASTDDEARLHEIDENLYRHELTPYDQAAFIEERWQIFHRLHGAAKRGRPTKKNGASSRQLTFWDDVTAKFGLPEEVAKKARRRRLQIPGEMWSKLRWCAVSRSGAELDRISKLDANEKSRVVDHLHKFPHLAVKDALRDIQGEKKSGTEEEKQYEALVKAWGRAGSSARQNFCLDYRSQVLSAFGGQTHG